MYSAGMHVQIEATDASSNYSANLISVGHPNYWVMYSGLATTTLCAKYLSSPIAHSEFLMGKNESVARDKTGCITQKYTLLNIP